MTMTVSAWDELRRGVQADLLGGVAAHFARLSWNSDQIHAEQRRCLTRLLTHAAEHSPFHARRLRGIDLDAVDPRDMSALPAMTKADMMADLDDVFTDRRVRRADVESVLSRTRAEAVPLLGRYVALASGGCSGARGVFVMDRMALATFATAVLRPPPSGSQPPSGDVIGAMVAAPSAVHATGLMTALAAGDNSFGRYRLLPATRPLAAIVEELNAMRPTMLAGYASMLVRLAAEARAGRLQIRPAQVSSTSETLLPELRSVIRAAFDAPVFDGFGSTEGLFGKTGSDDDTFAFNTDMCIVELVDSDDRPAPVGVPAAKVLITNLFNLTQPLIRYELTDTFVQVADAPGHGYLRARVQGRSDEIFQYPDGTAVHPIVIRSVVVATPEIVDYQVVQTAGGVDVFAVAAIDFGVDAFASRLAGALTEAGVARPQVNARAVERLDRNPVSGKFRRFVPLLEG
jgi:phenylacetate-coenzyme A ligase PaaK-like adenylate-forming protein